SPPGSTSLASATFRLEFFASAQCDGSGFGEGKQFLGTTNVTANASGGATSIPAPSRPLSRPGRRSRQRRSRRTATRPSSPPAARRPGPAGLRLQPPGVDDPLEELLRPRLLRRGEDLRGRPFLEDQAVVQEVDASGDVAGEA